MRTLLCALALCVFGQALPAHEFWIDPEKFQVDSGSDIVADIRVGQNFQGSAFAYVPRQFRLFEIAQEGARVPVEGRVGDRPAMTQSAGDGLAVILHATTDNRLTYDSLKKFENFVRHKDAAWTLDDHAAQGYPSESFVEVYSRYAKSLVAVGDGMGADREYGLETEIIALNNPYLSLETSEIDIRLMYKGAPRPNAQVEVFEKDSAGDVIISYVRTDDAGVASVPVVPGMTYMLDAVVLRTPSAAIAAETGAVWESLWANLTFAVPPE
jgi:hypothetical protein